MPIVNRAAVLGDPIDHSFSPAIHNAAYRAAGMTDWEYGRIRCSAEELPAVVGGADDSYRGFSVTMPGKFAALGFADEVSERARLIGSANTLVRKQGGWYADNTDGDGVIGALTEIGCTSAPRGRGLIVGAGGTARSALWALSHIGVTHVTVVARSERANGIEPLAAALGIEFSWVKFDAPNLSDIAGNADVVVSTVPSIAIETVAGYLARAPKILDVIYDPWPTPLVAAAERSGSDVVGGKSMLLHQAVGQFELFTGRDADLAAMRAALPN